MLQDCDPQRARLLLRLRPFLEAARYRACAPRGLALRGRVRPLPEGEGQSFRYRQQASHCGSDKRIWDRPNPLRKLSCGEDLGTDSQAFDEILFDRISNARTAALANLSIRRDFDRRIDDVLRPITLTRRDIARQCKIHETGKSDVMCSPDARFQHAGTPDRNSVIAANVMHGPGLPVPANAAELDVDDFASTDLYRFAGILGGMDRFIEADRRLDMFLKLGMIDDVFVMQTLLENHHVVAVHFFEVL